MTHPLLEPAAPSELGMLFSFHYYKTVNMTQWINRQPYTPTVFVDSGGFSAWSQGVDVDLRAYASWIRAHSSVFTHYANLDAIGDPKGTLANQLRMEKMGLRPLPITHFGCDPRSIASYAARGYDYQCLGGMVPQLRGVAQSIMHGNDDHPLLEWLDRCFVVAGEHGVRLHGFGATTWPLLLRYPWHSVDSSSWAAGYRYGQCMVFDYRRGRWATVRIGNKAHIMRFASLFKAYGASAMSLIRDDKFSRANIIKVSARSWLAAQRYLQARNADLQHVYLADSNVAGVDATRAIAAVIDQSPRVYLVEGSIKHLEGATQALGEEP